MHSNPVSPRHAIAFGRARRLALVLALAVAGSSVTLATPAAVTAWNTRDASPASEHLLATITNQSRASAGLRTLRLDAELVAIARWRSRDMAERDYFSHSIPPDGRKVFGELTARGYCFTVAGENIGWLGGADEGAEERIHQMFLESATHRAVILGEAWDAVGVGSYQRADGRHYWTILFAEACRLAAPTAAMAVPASRPTGMRVVPAPAPPGLFESLTAGIAGLFLGS